MHLLDLPPEIRESIYALLLSPNANRRALADDYTTYSYASTLLPLFLLNRQIYYEARRVFRDQNIFIRIETPWQEAQNTIAIEGHVPLLMTGQRANDFKGHTLTVSINAPGYAYLDTDMRRVICLADDLEKFTTMWKYSDLSHPGLNGHLRLNLSLRDPRTSLGGGGDWIERTVPRAVQARLFKPFGVVKDLHSLDVGGDPAPYSSIVKEMKAAMAVPVQSPESCLVEATRLKDAGNAALAAKRYEEALELYRQAWLAMHIIIKGRQRTIHAEAFFNRELREEPYASQNGHTVRLVLRVRLVANTVLVYLKMNMPEEARFWGMRTIAMIRHAIGIPDGAEAPSPQDEAILNFVAASEMGKIYYRTALAVKELNEDGDGKSQARKLLKVAQIYLPRDESVAKEVAAVALRLG